MKNRQIRYYLVTDWFIQLTVLNIFHYLYKYYDRSYDNLWQYNNRGIALHIFFVLFGLLVWNTGKWLSQLIHHSLFRKIKKTASGIVITTVLFAAYGVFFSVIFGALVYHFFFLRIGMEQEWSDYHLFDRDLIVIMFIFYIIAFSIDAVKYYTRRLKKTQIDTERLKRENIQSKFEALKNQIDPHFFFNSLSVLTSLVYKDANLSAEYITKLSKMYRYILEGKNQSIVSLENELDFLNSYIFLIKIRYDESIRVSIDLEEGMKETIFLPKTSLQMLAENAIKHNRFDEDSPLIIQISANSEYIIVENNKDKRTLLEGSSGIGLENIRKRYELIGDFELVIQETATSFIVKLPKISVYEAKHFDI